MATDSVALLDTYIYLMRCLRETDTMLLLYFCIESIIRWQEALVIRHGLRYMSIRYITICAILCIIAVKSRSKQADVVHLCQVCHYSQK